MSPASISHKDDEVGMGRTKHRLPPRSKSKREFDHEIGNIVFVLNAIDAGQLDHLFVDAETKAAVRADCGKVAEGLRTQRIQGADAFASPGVEVD
jgi:hypothetical protein